MRDLTGGPGATLPRRSVGRRLTDRQAALLQYVAEGLENKEIAERLGIAEQTVKEQVSNLLQRLAVRNRAALAEIATQMRIFGTTIDETWIPDLFAKAPYGIMLLRGPELRIELVNEYLVSHIGGLDPTGKTLREVFNAAAAEAHELVEGAYRSGRSVIGHEYAVRWDRSGAGPEDGYADFVIHPLRDAAGKVNGLLLIVLDVTELVRGNARVA